MSLESHRQEGPKRARCAVVTVSDTRTVESDTSGAKIRELLEAAGHEVAAYRIVHDEPTLVTEILRPLLADPDVDVIFLNGGTGLAPRDTTFETVERLLDKELSGFGELFRMLSFQEIGPSAMLSRAVAGVASRTFLAAMPGSTKAVSLAMEKLLLPELGHILGLIGR